MLSCLVIFLDRFRCLSTKNSSKKHKNGTERIAEAAKKLKLKSKDIIIDVQGDEPLINTNDIDFVNNPKDLAEIIDFIKQPSEGTRYFNPMKTFK